LELPGVIKKIWSETLHSAKNAELGGLRQKKQYCVSKDQKRAAEGEIGWGGNASRQGGGGDGRQRENCFWSPAAPYGAAKCEDVSGSGKVWSEEV